MKKKVAGRRRPKRAPSRGGGGGGGEGYVGTPPPPFPAYATANNPYGGHQEGMGGVLRPGPPGGGPMAPRRSESPAFANQGHWVPPGGDGGDDGYGYPPHPSHAGAPTMGMGIMGHRPHDGGGYGGASQYEAPPRPGARAPPPPCCCKPMLRRDYGYKCRNEKCGIKRSKKWAEQVRAGTQRIPPTCSTCNQTLKKLSAKAPYKCPNRHFHFLVEKYNNE
eukprot:scaffold1248_cov170-Amphora_coffeaeformis.AAC.10